MMAKDNGGLAFPQPTFEHSSTGEVYGAGSWDPLNGGMSLRDWFAGQALAALLSDGGTQAIVSKLARESHAHPTSYFAASAYEFADAMIEERSK